MLDAWWSQEDGDVVVITEKSCAASGWWRTPKNPESGAFEDERMQIPILKALSKNLLISDKNEDVKPKKAP